MNEHPAAIPRLNRRRALWATCSAMGLVLAGCASAPAVDPAITIQAAQQAMGGAQLKSLRYAGTGTGGTFGQAYLPEMPWPKITVSNFVRVLDYENAALRQDTTVSRAEPQGGGALPLMGTGELRATGLVQGKTAWNMVGPAAVAAPVFMEARVHDLWTTPHGVLMAALRNRATSGIRTVDGKRYTTLSFAETGLYEATAYVSADNLVERVESRHPHPVVGDVESVTTYSGYKDYAGVKFPSRITQSLGGSNVFDINVSEVQANVTAGISTPDNVKQFAERVVVEKAAEGVWFLAGGSHNSVLIEMKDHAVLVESPLYDGRASAVLAEAKKLLPAKPVRYVINSHHHFDHAGGLRTAVADGATLITSAAAKPWFDKVFSNPNRIAPDALAKSGRSAQIEAVDGRRVLTDGVRTIEIREIAGSVHAQGFLMVYLPREKILIEADAYTPGAPNSPAPAVPNGNNLNLVQNIESVPLAVERILPLHGRMVNVTELMTAVGRN